MLKDLEMKNHELITNKEKSQSRFREKEIALHVFTLRVKSVRDPHGSSCTCHKDFGVETSGIGALKN